MSTSSSSSKPSGMWQPPTLEEMQAMLPQYQFISLLGRGGMGAVYKAVQVSLDRPVAIKVLPGDLVMDEDVQFAERFKNEARTMARMSHPGIVNVFDFGETQTGLLYIVMEFIDGTDISKMILSQGRLTEDYALAITAHVCDALNYAHRNGVVHRDIKPANILINMAGEIKVADFGLAKANDASQSGGLTKTNMAMGTPDFVAPEAFIPGFALDGRADLYAIGVMLYQMLTGDIPRGMWTMPSQRIGSDPRFDAIIGKAMQTDREMRYQSASEIRQELDAILTTPISVIIAHQQAAAEVAARVTQAQKQAASAPQRRNVPPEPIATPPVKKSNLGLILGIAASITLAAGLYVMLKDDGTKKTQPLDNAASPSTPATPTPVENISVTPTPPAPAVASATPAPEPEMPATPPPPPSSDLKSAAVASTAPTMPAVVPAAPSPATLAPAPTNTTNIAGPPKLETKRLPGTADSLVVACSADGTRLIMAETLPNGAIHLSKDSGATWTTASVSGRWRAVTSSADGTKLAAAKEAGFIYTSADAGNTWTELINSAGNWNSLACSADGTRIVAVEHEKSPTVAGAIYISSDSGITWTKKDAGGDWWKGVASSADGTKLVAVSNGYATGSYIFVSHDSGATWSKCMTAGVRRWSSVASSADGSRLVAVDAGFGSGGQIYTSADFGETWTPREANRVWSAVTSSADGKIMAAAAGCLIDAQFSGAHIDTIYISSDFGETWQPREMTRDWRSIASSADGALLVSTAIGENGTGQVFVLDFRTAAAKAGNDPRIAQLEKGFNGRLETDAEQPFRTALAKLNQSYVANGIAKARATAQAKGSLLEVTMFDAEKTLIEKGGTVPAEDPTETPAPLKTLRNTYRTALAKITAERDAKVAPLYDLYLKALDAYVADLTKSNKLDEAKRMSALRVDLANQKPQTAAASVATSTPTAPVPLNPTTPAKPSPTSGSTWRNAAEFLVNNGGSFVASKNGTNSPVTAAKDIPVGRFDIIELSLDRLNSLLPPLKDKDLLPLVGLRDLRRVWVRPSGSALNDGAFSFLAGNDELNWLNLEGVNEATDEVLIHLASAKKLDFLSIQYAPKFTGKGLGNLPCRETLTGLDLLACGISDDGLKAISTFKQLKMLRITSGTASDQDFALLGGLKSLTNLTVSTTGFGNKAAEAISTRTGLTRLDAASTKLTNSGLEKLYALKNLTELILSGTEVSPQAAADFQKAMPQCKVSR